MLSKNQIKEIQSLQLKKMRDTKELFIAEGLKTVTEILETKPELIKTIFGTADFLKNYGAILNEQEVEYFLVEDEELKKISLHPTPNKALAVCHYFAQPHLQEKPHGPLAFYLDDIRDPGNFGTIVRLCAWFGFSVLYCSESSCDLYNPKVIQSSMGAFLRVQVVYTDLKKLISEIKPAKVYGAVLEGDNLFSKEVQGGLIIIGNEANGISETNLKYVTDKVTIPSGGTSDTESLNAAMAASILASEFFRQLSKK